MTDVGRTDARSGPRANSPTVAACQMGVADLDPAANCSAIESRVADLPPEVDVALFPEYALTGFVADERIREVALARDGPVLDRLRDAAADSDTALLVGFAEDDGDAAATASASDTLYNAVAYLDPRDGTGESAVETTVYRKRHLWADERAVLAPGRERVTVETPVGTAALLTCYDLNFVGESAAFARPGVEALFVVGAWPAAYSQNWTLLLRARALDGVRWVVAAGRTGEKNVADEMKMVKRPPHISEDPENMVGDEENIPENAARYAGRSRVVRPDGSVLAGLNRAERDLVAELDPAVLAECREFVPVFEE